MASFSFKHFLLVLFFLSPLHYSIIKVKSVDTYCPDTAANYTTDSAFYTNLNLLLASLGTNAPPTRFANGTKGGQGADQVFGLAQCDADNTIEECQSCLTSAIKEVVQSCPNKRASAKWIWPSGTRTGNCFLRYSNSNFFSFPDMSYISRSGNNGNVTEPERFIKVLGGLLNVDADRASFSSKNEMFATGEANWTSFNKLYSLVLCTRDLSGPDCFRCLTEFFGTLPSKDWIPKSGWVTGLSCRFRYDVYPFYKLTASSAASPPASPTSDAILQHGTSVGEKKNTLRIALGISIPMIVICLLLVAIYIGSKRRRTVRQTPGNQQEIRSIESLLLDLGVLKAATSNFSEDLKLGEGGFGPVYRGKMLDGQDIAVKRLSKCSAQGLQELKNEVVLVARLQHKNLVRLLGCCLQDQEKLLVYEYLPNLSLDKFLFDPAKAPQIDWAKRYKIIEGIARGLLYLHEDSRLKIIHRDLKASNILIDKDMVPKISDFGLAKQFDTDQSQANTSRVAGTYGYMAPEYIINGIFSTKSDVFSYGVLILEIVTGRRNSEFRGSRASTDLLSYAWRHWNEHTALQIVDQNLSEQCQSHQVLRCIHIGLLCVQEDEAMRPNMSTVVLMLNSTSFTLQSPSIPAFFHKSIMGHLMPFSANDASVPDLEAR